MSCVPASPSGHPHPHVLGTSQLPPQLGSRWRGGHRYSLGYPAPPNPLGTPTVPWFSPPFPELGQQGRGRREQEKRGAKAGTPRTGNGGHRAGICPVFVCPLCPPPSGASPSTAPSPPRGDGIRTSPNAPANGVFALPGPYRPALISGYGPPRADPPDSVTSMSPSTRGAQPGRPRAPPDLSNTLWGHPRRDHSRFPQARGGGGLWHHSGGSSPRAARTGGSLRVGCTPGMWNPPSIGFPPWDIPAASVPQFPQL